LPLGVIFKQIGVGQWCWWSACGKTGNGEEGISAGNCHHIEKQNNHERIIFIASLTLSPKFHKVPLLANYNLEPHMNLKMELKNVAPSLINMTQYELKMELKNVAPSLINMTQHRPPQPSQAFLYTSSS
jgi:hypothetical protein